jgi:pimeloyl-ACP methyl ester carboxylesterase
MQILYELRYPTKWYMKLLMALAAVVFFAVLATTSIAGFLVYRIVKPQRASTEINMASFPGRPEVLNFQVPGEEGQKEGWFFPGLRGAATVILCHGYESSRGELLTLESALQDHQYNVFIFDFTAHGANQGISSLGYKEVEEVRAAVDVVATRTDLDPRRFGLWGYNMGAYAALREAENDKRIRAMVLDSVYDDPKQMVKVGVERNGLAGFPFMIRAAELSFEYLNYAHKEDPPISRKLSAMAGVPILYIQALDDPELAETTRQMFLKAPEPREQAIIPHGNFVSLNDEDKRTYENRVVSFFLVRLPPVT